MASTKAMKKQVASQLGISHMNQTAKKGRFQGTRHMQVAKGPIIPPGSKKGSVLASSGKKAVTKMKTTKKMHTKGTHAGLKSKLHGTSKTRTSKTKQNYGKVY